ncbi:MAG TPA: 2-amino-4-hydroxy-6-hydroxymethyldihydropteridine diphosphokinase [Anaerolineae bacterium]|jgi:2-amino-4-hydroxy-6-hydroxymethyldihydropteridine diphosphokinase
MTEQQRVYLAAGTNLGDREHNLRRALQTLPPQVAILAVSRLYETAPAYVVDQPSFLNIALAGRTALAPDDLLTYLKEIEASLGREKAIRFGPRQLDLDIIFYNDRIIDEPHLKIPHPRLAERGFVLRPLVDIAPDFVHPVLKQTLVELATQLPPDDGILSAVDWQPL